jgi:predicted kinase
MAGRFILITGEVGTGKTTIARALTANLQGKQEDSPVAHIAYATERGGTPVLAIRLGRGHHTKTSGLDTINAADYEKLYSPNGGWIRKLDGPVVIADGNQLAHTKALEALKAAGVAVTVYRLTADPAIARSRTASRPEPYAPTASARTRTESHLDNLEDKLTVRKLDTSHTSPEATARTIARQQNLASALRL